MVYLYSSSAAMNLRACFLETRLKVIFHCKTDLCFSYNSLLVLLAIALEILKETVQTGNMLL